MVTQVPRSKLYKGHQSIICIDFAIGSAVSKRRTTLFLRNPNYRLLPLTGLRERRSSIASPSSEPEWSEYRLLRSTPGGGDLDLDKDRDLDLDLERVGDLDRDIDLDDLERDGERE